MPTDNRNEPSAITAQSIYDDLILLWGQKTKIIISTVFFTIVGILYAIISPSIYQATALVQASQVNSSGNLKGLANQFGGLASLAGVRLGQTNSETSRILATLKSRIIVSTIIKNENLMPILYPELWDNEKNEWIDSEKKYPPTLYDAVDDFNEEIMRVSTDEVTGLITISMQWTDREVLTSWINKILLLTNEHLRTLDKKKSLRNLTFLNNQMQIAKVAEVKSSIAEMIKVETQNLMLADSSDEYALQIIDPAVTPGVFNEIKPKRTFIVIVSCFFGGVVGLIWSFLSIFFSEIKRKKFTQN